MCPKFRSGKINNKYTNTLHVTKYKNASKKKHVKKYFSNKIGSMREQHDELHRYMLKLKKYGVAVLDKQWLPEDG
jgi:hypothetical protein